MQATRDFSVMFIGTTYAPFLKSIGLDNAQITIVNWAFASLMLLAQVPTGLFADKFGRALSIKIGLVVLMLGHFAYFFATGFWSALVIEGAVGLGLAFVGGADQAWLVASLNARGQGKDVQAAFGTANSVSFTACLVSGSLGALIGARDFRWPWIACGLTGILPVILTVAFMREPPPSASAPPPPDRGNKTVDPKEDLARLSWRLLRGSYDLKWSLAAICALAFATPFFHYWPLVFRDQVGPYSMAVLWLAIYSPKVLGAVSMRLWSHKLANGRGILALSCALGTAGLGLFAAGRSVGLAALLLGTLAFEFALGYFQPLASAFVQRRVVEKCRATYGSLQSLLSGTWSVVVMIGIAGAMATRPDTVASIKDLWWQMGALMCVAAVPVFLFRPKGHQP